MSSVPGILHVLTDPGPDVTLHEFHDWYNNEHGPMRMRFPSVKCGVRYEATDGLSPPWMASYELDDIAFLYDSKYTQLRKNRSPRESNIISRMAIIDRTIYRLIISEGLPNTEMGSVAVTVCLVVPKAFSENLEQWYSKVTIYELSKHRSVKYNLTPKEHISMLSGVPGWCRSRLLVDVSSGSSEVSNYIAIHEYTDSNGLGGPAHMTSQSTPWRARVMSSLRYPAIRRIFKLHRVFSKLANDLFHLSPDVPCVIDSFYPRDDGFKLRYRLEGSPTGPVIAFCNSLLTDLHIWDHIIPYLTTNCRVLRYDARGHGLSTTCSIKPKIADLSADLFSLISALNIPKLHAIIGVSLGGVVALHFALHNPTCVTRFIGADFNVASSPANNAAWEMRIALARSSVSGHAELARQTIARWFIPASAQTLNAQAVEKMIHGTSLSGFEGGVHALCDYDLRDALPSLSMPALFIAGRKDGVLPDTMRRFSMTVLDSRFSVIEDSGHLPMVENPEAFWNEIANFL